jgi:uncharacterized membrane protein
VVAATIGEWETALASTAQLAVNLIGIVIAAVLMLLLRTRRDRADLRRPLSEG